MATNFLSGRNARLCLPPQALVPGLCWSAHGAAANSGIWPYYTSQGLKKTKPKWLANMWSRRLIIPQVHICITSVQQEVCNVWGRISSVFRVQGLHCPFKLREMDVQALLLQQLKWHFVNLLCYVKSLGYILILFVCWHFSDVVIECIKGLVETYPKLTYLDGFPEVWILCIVWLSLQPVHWTHPAVMMVWLKWSLFSCIENLAAIDGAKLDDRFLWEAC